MHVFRLVFVGLFLVLAMVGCQSSALDQARQMSLRPGALVDPLPAENATELFPDAEAEARSEGEGSHNRRLLSDMAAGDLEFNRRLSGVLNQGRDPRLQGHDLAAPRSVQGETTPVSFDFFDADLANVVRLFMELLQENYSLDSKVGGKVSLHVKADMSQGEIWELFRGLLRMHGAVATLDNGIWRIVPLGEAPTAVDAGDIVFDKDGARKRGQNVQVFKLDYLPVSEFSNVIKPYLSAGSMVYGHEQTGIMLVSDFPHTLRKIARLVEIFDVSAFAGLHMRVYSLKYVTAEEMLKELDGVVQATMFKQQGRERVSFLGLPRLNMIVALTWNEANLPFVEEWIQQLDRIPASVAATGQGESIFVYRMENGDAKTLVSSLEGLFASRDTELPRRKDSLEEKDLPVGAQLAATEDQGNFVDNTMKTAAEEKAQAQIEHRTAGFAGNLSGPVSFVVDEPTNSVLVRCSESDYRIIRNVIDQLDIFPRQVLIEVLIAEINLDESNKLGVEWEYIFNLGGSATGTLGIDSSLGLVSPGATSPIASGLSYVVGNTERFKSALKASASENNVQILSSPHILASDNQAATIDIGSEVPVVTGTTQTSGGTVTTQQNVQYRNTGVLLTVTPHINDKGLVRMEVSQEVSELSDKQVEGISSPIFSKRKAQTVLAVQNGQTIVIGGLIRKTRTDTYSGVPLLSKIPILKHLSGYQNKGWENTELMLFITPHVVAHNEDVEFVSRNFLKRLEDVKQGVR